MESKKDNLKALYSNTRTRIIIIFTMVLLVLAVVIGYMKMRSSVSGPESTAAVMNAPGSIQSIPGAQNQTAQYTKLQEEQNLTQAKTAQVTGGSAIPTIIRTQALGEGVGVIGAQGGQSGVGFSALSMEDNSGTQKSLWLEELKNASCSKSSVTKILGQGAQLSDVKGACSCIQLKDMGYVLKDLEPVCECTELKAAGFNARQLKDAGYTDGRLRLCGFDACELRNAGFTAQEMKDGGFTDGELKGAGYPADEILKASGLPGGITSDDVRKAGCSVAALTKLRAAGVSATAIRKMSGCSAAQLKAAGYTAKELKDAGFSAADLKNAGFSAAELKSAGFTPEELLNAGYTADDLAKAAFTDAQIKAAGLASISANEKVADCSVASLKRARAAGVSALTIRNTLGCSAKALMEAGYSAKDLKNAGFTAAELKAADFSAKDLMDAGLSAKELKDAGFSTKELKDAGLSPQDLKDAGFSAKDLKDAGFSAQELKDAGFSAKDLKNAGLSAKDLKDAGFSPADLKSAGFAAQELKAAGFSQNELKGAGFSDNDLKAAGYAPAESTVAGLANPNLQQPTSTVNAIPAMQGQQSATSQAAANNMQLQAILNKQNQQMSEQKYQQKIQQRTSEMTSAANQSIQEWKKVNSQAYVASSIKEKEGEAGAALAGVVKANDLAETLPGAADSANKAVIKTGDILFAVMDTSVNSDEPGPILATIVSGKLKGAKLIGSFNLPANSNKMIITFNTISIPGAAKTSSISAFAIDPNTARTALSSRTNHHYLMRYGSLFASSFIEGFGNAFQSAGTTITIGGTGGGNNVTIQNGLGRSTLQNAVIGLATVGKSWGQQAQQLFSTPTTVEVYSGTGIGVLFTQDVTNI